MSPRRQPTTAGQPRFARTPQAAHGKAGVDCSERGTFLDGLAITLKRHFIQVTVGEVFFGRSNASPSARLIADVRMPSEAHRQPIDWTEISTERRPCDHLLHLSRTYPYFDVLAGF